MTCPVCANQTCLDDCVPIIHVTKKNFLVKVKNENHTIIANGNLVGFTGYILPTSDHVKLVESMVKILKANFDYAFKKYGDEFNFEKVLEYKCCTIAVECLKSIGYTVEITEEK